MTEQEYTEYLSDIDHTDWRMDWTIANEAWDNGKITLDELRAVALATLTGDELEDALADIQDAR